MRTLLVVNSFATTTTPEVQSVITSALANHLDLTVMTTAERLHAIEIGKQAIKDKFELVISLGGDGTLNELVNGLLDGEPSDSLPVLAGIPGGNANVFIRNLGYSNDPVTATAQLIENIGRKSTRKLGVGRISYLNQKRWFLFNAGIGLDARVLSKMEEKRTQGKTASDLSYALITLKELFAEVRNGRAQLTITDQDERTYGETQFALIVNFSPWTYVGKFAISPSRRQVDTSAFDVYAPYELSVSRTAQLIRDLVLRGELEKNENVLVLTKQKSMTITASQPTWLQTDGEALDLVTTAKIEHFADCLTVFA